MGMGFAERERQEFKGMINEELEATPEDSRYPWKGFIYPDRSNLLHDIPIGDFETLEACRASSAARLLEANATEIGDYECGYLCNRRRGIADIWLCKETLR